jgi:hypothetical protein
MEEAVWKKVYRTFGVPAPFKLRISMTYFTCPRSVAQIRKLYVFLAQQ